MIEQQKVKVKCLNCNHEWKIKSKLVRTTCPSCQLKLPVMNNLILKDIVKGLR